jgi:hypothetical protein
MSKRTSSRSTPTAKRTPPDAGACNAMFVAVEREEGSDNLLVLVTAEAVRAADIPELSTAWKVLYEHRNDRVVHCAEPGADSHPELYRYAIILTHASTQLPRGIELLRTALAEEESGAWREWVAHPDLRTLEGTHTPVDYTFGVQDWDMS